MEKSYISEMVGIVYQAGALIKDIHGDFAIKEKEGGVNLVTKYDSMVQRFLEEKLSAMIPGCTFLAEEDGQSEVKNHEGYQFVIDPIDGTTNFVVGFMLSGICVGLAKDGELIDGVVYNPFRDEMFYAEKGKGAFLNGRPIRTEDRPLSGGVIVFGAAPYNPERRDFAYDSYKVVSNYVMDVHEIGSAALGICYAACGRAIAYASPGLSAWDYAAASIILQEAGGVFTDYYGKPMDLRSSCSYIGTTPTAHKQFLEVMKDTIEKHNYTL